mmetsp:Transcript_21433/g.46561  ORF Transcript_21433/g.46561 Transcript_21433/m.46561 type:complete len:171 (+) Transcript_21433:269-781(+)|eukprot:CAMPEP_0172325898 /NCGR_PEP_ID=MMETSP1058-20130122/54977_1 /TAXON_ID=83371 /ORGANISM="Detonula confervacea, Strain CCMP 353" /LENGTH=170 /DNA_ID=CAMNT_0013042533 /DNA_START=222 /DNA_END=734 /DNA_ORIENTATION=+
MMDMKTISSFDKESQRVELLGLDGEEDESTHRDKSPRHTFLYLMVLSAVIVFAFNDVYGPSSVQEPSGLQLDAGQRRLDTDAMPLLVGDGGYLLADLETTPDEYYEYVPITNEESPTPFVGDATVEHATMLGTDNNSIDRGGAIDTESSKPSDENARVEAAVAKANLLLL